MSVKQMLAYGLKDLKIQASEEQEQKLLDYLALLLKWNSTYNLTAIRTEEKMLSHHIIDSLSLIPHLPEVKSLIDVGSGGGMPGIPCAIMRPEMNVVLLDSNHKKTTFLRQALIELKLDNAQVETSRVESLKGQTFDIVTSRAFADLSDFVNLTKGLLAPDGMWFAMKGVYPYEEIATLPEFAKEEKVIPLEVPFVEAERHLVCLSKQV